MAHYTRVRANQTAWQSGVVTDEEWEKFDANQLGAVNGDAGGVWAPVAPVVIGGAGLEVSGLFEATGEAEFWDSVVIHSGGSLDVNGPTNFDGDCTIGNTSGDDLIVEATSAFNSPANFNEEVDCFDRFECHDTTIVQGASSSFSAYCDVTLGLNSGDALEVNATAAFDAVASFNDQALFYDTAVFYEAVAFVNDVDFDGEVTMNDQVDFWDALIVHTGGSLTCSGPFLASNDATFGQSGSDALLIYSTTTIRQPLQFDFNGRVPMRPRTGPNAGSSNNFTVSDGDVIVTPILSANRQYTILDSGSQDGDQFWVSHRTGLFNLTVELPTGVQWVLSPATLASGPSVGWFMRVDGSWVALMVRNP